MKIFQWKILANKRAKPWEQRGVSIALACRAFDISESCYRYEPILSDENALIADWLVSLTKARKNWGFGFCFLYLHNVRGYHWNQKRVYRIYCELQLNLRIKPRRRLERERPDPLHPPSLPNQIWSMDFMADQLWNGRKFLTLNVLDGFNREGFQAVHEVTIRPVDELSAETGNAQAGD